MKGAIENKRRYCHPLPVFRGTHFQNAAYSVRVAASSRYITSLTAEELCDPSFSRLCAAIPHSESEAGEALVIAVL